MSVCRPIASASLARPLINYDVVRGVLILAVLCDHNDLIRSDRAVNAWFLPMTFHVTGFLFLPFLNSKRHLGTTGLLDLAVRYLVPFVAATVVYTCAYHVLIRRGVGVEAVATSFVQALAIASTPFLETATGFVMLWFLPALLSTVLLLSLHQRLPRPGKAVVLGAAMAAHAVIGQLPEPIKTFVPQGWLIALYVFPVGLCVGWASRRVAAHRMLISLACALVLLLCWRFTVGREIEIATLVLPTWREPLVLAASDVSEIAFTIALLHASSYVRMPGLATIGRYSLVVYLVHPLLYKLVFPAIELLRPQLSSFGLGTNVIAVGSSILSVVIVALSSVAFAVAVRSFEPTRKLLTPRDALDWPPTSLWLRHSNGLA